MKRITITIATLNEAFSENADSEIKRILKRLIDEGDFSESRNLRDVNGNRVGALIVNCNLKEMEGKMYLIKKISDGTFLTKSGCKTVYSFKISEIRVFKTRTEAKNNCSMYNEVVVDIRDILSSLVF